MIFVFLAVVAGAPPGVAPPCPAGKTICTPWERKWGPQLPITGDIITGDGRLLPRATLAGIALGQPLAAVQRDFASRGRHVVRVNETFAEPYVLYNLLSERKEIIGNVGFCRGVVDNVVIHINSASEHLKALKRYVSEYRQPAIRIESTPTDDDTTSFDSVIHDWPAQHVSVSFAIAASDEAQGAIILGESKPCR